MFDGLRRRSPAGSMGRHLKSERFRGTVYAVGDVHGCLRELMALEAVIAADRQRRPGPHLIIYLGDYVDRGPDSAGVLRHLREPSQPGAPARIALLGNHEVMMAGFLADPRGNPGWLAAGGAETLRSYGIEPADAAEPRRLVGLLSSRIPAADRVFLTTRPLTCQVNRCLFVHAGFQVGVPVDQQSEQDLLWRHLDPADPLSGSPWVIVHGHSVQPEPMVVGQRIAIDTGAFRTGRLTAARIGPDGVGFLSN